MSQKQIIPLGMHAGAFLLKTFLLVGLGLQGLLLYCLLAFGHIPLPANLANEWLRKHSIEDFYFQGQSYELELSGTLRIYEAKVFQEGLPSPIIEAQCLDLQFTPGSKSLAQLSLYRGTLFQPAPYAPDGQRHEVLRELGLDLGFSPEDAVLNLKAFTARYGPLRIVASASIEAASLPGINATGTTTADPLKSLFEQLAYTPERAAFLQTVQDPLLRLRLDQDQRPRTAAGPNEALQLAVSLEAEHFSHNVLEINALQIRTLAKLEAGSLALDETLHFGASSLVYEQGQRFHVKNPTGQIPTHEALALANGQWPNCWIRADAISAFGKSVQAATLQLSRTGPESVKLVALGNGFDGSIAFEGTLNSETYSGTGILQGALNPQTLLSDAAVKQLPKLQLSGPSYCEVKLQWGPRFEQPKARAFAHFIQPQLNGVDFEVVTLNAGLDSKGLNIQPLRFKRGTQWLALDFFQNFESQTYDIRTQGRLIPAHYNPFMPHWWRNIFNKDFSFNDESQVGGDCVIYGKTSPFSTDFYYGQFEARKLAYRNVPIHAGQFTLRGRNRYVEIHKLDAQSGADWIKGDIQFTGYPDEIRASAAIRYDLKGRLPLQKLRKLLPPQTATKLALFNTTQAPHLRFQAAQFREKDYPQFEGMSHLELDVDAPEPLEYHNLPLQYLRFKLYAREQGLSIRKLDFGMAGGVGTGAIDQFKAPSGAAPWLRLDLQVNNADYSHTRALLADFKENAARDPEAPSPDSSENGLVQLYLQSEGPANDLDQHSGFGRFNLDYEKLAKIQLLGPFSMILEKTPLGFTSLKLNQMRSDFALAGGYLKFSPLNITGPQTRIEANGTLKLSDQALDLVVGVDLTGSLNEKFNPFKPITDILNPLNYLLQFRITGTLDDQTVRSLYDPRNLLPGGND
jgi:hypothetical protein